MLLLVVMLLDSSPPELESFVELESVLWVSVEAELVALFVALRLGPGKKGKNTAGKNNISITGKLKRSLVFEYNEIHY